MATIKSHTDLPQSKKLAEILPIESADMFYDNIIDSVTGELFIPADGSTIKIGKGLGGSIAAWSLAALLDIIPYTIYKSDNEFYRLEIDKGYNDYAIWYSNNGLTVNDLDVTSDNFVDACVEMIIKLHELNLL